MGKANKKSKVAAATTQAAPVTAPQTAELVYQVAGNKRGLAALKAETVKQQSNTGTMAALARAAAENGGMLTASQALAVCQERQHASFYKYAVRSHWLLPVAAAQ